jgi:hypothetical protein
MTAFLAHRDKPPKGVDKSGQNIVPGGVETGSGGVVFAPFCVDLAVKGAGKSDNFADISRVCLPLSMLAPLW